MYMLNLRHLNLLQIYVVNLQEIYVPNLHQIYALNLQRVKAKFYCILRPSLSIPQATTLLFLLLVRLVHLPPSFLPSFLP
jgi:hypothetical protein